LAATGTVGAARTGLILAKAITFLVVAIGLGIRYSPVLLAWVGQMKVRGSLIVYAIFFCVLLAAAAERSGLAAIIGAFAAGLILAKTERRAHSEAQTRPVAGLFVPIFFVAVGMQVEPGLLRPFPRLGSGPSTERRDGGGAPPSRGGAGLLLRGGGLLRDDLALDPLVGRLGHDLTPDELVLAFVRTPLDDLLRVRFADTGKRLELVRRRAVEVERLLLRLALGPRRRGRLGGGLLRRRLVLRPDRRRLQGAHGEQHCDAPRHRPFHGSSLRPAGPGPAPRLRVRVSLGRPPIIPATDAALREDLRGRAGHRTAPRRRRPDRRGPRRADTATPPPGPAVRRAPLGTPRRRRGLHPRRRPRLLLHLRPLPRAPLPHRAPRPAAGARSDGAAPRLRHASAPAGVGGARREDARPDARGRFHEPALARRPRRA